MHSCGQKSGVYFYLIQIPDREALRHGGMISDLVTVQSSADRDDI